MARYGVTHIGREYLPLVTAALDQLSEAGHRLGSMQSENLLTVSALPSVASKWLSLNLIDWCEENPGNEIRLVAQHREVDFQSEEVDFRICYGDSLYTAHNVKKLFRDKVFPVCSPALLEGENALRTPGDLAHTTLLHVSWGENYRSLPTWKDWLEEAGINDVDCSRGPQFNLSSIAIQAAIAGKGVMLGQQMMVAGDLATGRLVVPFDLQLSLGECYYLAFPDEVFLKAPAERFIDWIMELSRQH